MSVFAPGASQIWTMEPRIPRSQFHARNDGTFFAYVAAWAWRETTWRPSDLVSRYNAAQGEINWCGRTSRHAGDSRDRAFVHCFGCGEARAEPSTETIARGKALGEAADCASCHTADPAKPFAGGKRIDTPFGGIYSPNLTPDRDTGIGAWSDEQFHPRAAPWHRARRFAILPGVPLSQFHQNDPRRPSGDPGLSRDADAIPQYARRRRNCAGR